MSLNVKRGMPEWEVMVEAVEVAMAAPLKHGNAYGANIPWKTIIALRAALDAAGIDWRKAKETRSANRLTRKEE